MRVLTPILLAAMFVCSDTPLLRAQAGSAAPEAAATRLQIAAGYEVRREHLRYTFENESNIDTDFLVPHAFTQRYVANNQWFVAAARYSIRGDAMQSEFGFAPERQTRGSDLDTFHNPNNDIVVSGTAGEVRLRSLRFAQWSEGRLLGLPWRAGYVFRRDRSQFLPTDRIVTHSNPPSEVRSPTFGRETTISQVHEIALEASRPLQLSSAWRFVPTAELSPLLFARLITKLPDKYPGQDIVFDAKSFGLGGGIELTRQRGWPISVTLRYRQVWGYRTARQFRRDSLEAAIRFSS